MFHSNDYSSFKCPCCHGNNFKFHKTYKRNITLIFNEYLLEGTIDIIVIECLSCRNNMENQHYHAILPDMILPYHLSSSAVIFNAINDKVDKIKNEIIMERYRISRQLLNKWLKLMNKYLLSSSIILSLELDIRIVVKGIINNKDIFLYEFYNKYFHPFFLNKRTCVKLAITP